MRTVALCLLLAVCAAGCASTLHPERVNQPVENRGGVDLPLAIGNLAVPGGTVLLLYDMHTGAIYKPKEEPKTGAPPTGSKP